MEPEKLVNLDAQACRQLLPATTVGRMATIAGNRPHIVVLNHWVHEDRIYFRTTEATWNSMTDRADAQATVPAAYEVDSTFAMGREGWSVVVNGRLSQEHDAAIETMVHERVQPWAEGERHVVLRLDPETMSGISVG